jgi:O-antigen/teichoic acid export membrane protein
VADYGVLGILEVTIALFTQVLLLGQPASYLRYFNSQKSKRQRKSTFFTIFIFLLAMTSVFLLFSNLLIPKAASLFEHPAEFEIYFKLCSYVIFFRVMNNLSMSVLRAKEKSSFYAFSSVVKILSTLSFTIYFVVFAQLGIKGIFYAYIIGEILLIIILLPTILGELSPTFDKKLFYASLAFGFPIIFSALASMLLNVGDRYILKLLVNYKEVGLYDLGYRIANLVNVFLIQPFLLGFLPQAYQIYGKEGDKRYYSKMLTYVVFGLCWVGLAVAISGKFIIETFAAKPEFYPAYQVIPIIVFANVFNGAKTVLNIGMFLKEKTRYVAYATILAALVNIGLNFVLIPHFGMKGAAVATVIAFLLFDLVSYYFSNRFYPIPYEISKILKMIIVALVLFGISQIATGLPAGGEIMIKTGLWFMFPILLYFWRFFEPVEIERLKEFAQKILHQG